MPSMETRKRNREGTAPSPGCLWNAEGPQQDLARAAKVARQYFTRVYTIQNYARKQWPEAGLTNPGGLLEPGKRRISQLIVAFHEAEDDRPVPAQQGAPSMQREAVNRTLEDYFANHKNPKNVICCGQFSSTSAVNASAPLGVDSHAPSTAVNILKAPDFCQLVESIGFSAMKFLLCRACLLLPVPSSHGEEPRKGTCLYQLTGNPPRRRRGSDPGVAVYKAVDLRRGKPHRLGQVNGRRAVFEQGHVLCGAHASKRAARRLFEEIFGEEIPAAKTKADKSAAGRVGSKKRRDRGTRVGRRREEELVQLLHQVLQRASTKQLTYVLNKHCPVRERLLESVNLEDTQPSSGQPTSSSTPDLMGSKFPLGQGAGSGEAARRASAMGLCDIFREAPLDVLLANSSTDREIGRFVYSICTALLPRELLGCQHNWRELRRLISILLRARKFDVVGLGTFHSRFRVTTIGWLGVGLHRGTVHPSDLEKRKKLLGTLLQFVVRDVIRAAVRANFHCTRREPTRNRSVFYRRPVWWEIANRSTQALLSSNFRQISVWRMRQVKAEREQHGLGFWCARFRWVPKTSGVRALQLVEKEDKIGMQCFWKDVGAVLMHELRDVPSAGVMSHRDVYRKFLPFKRAWRHRGSPRVFCAKFDIKRSFDTIMGRKLAKEILPKYLRRVDYVIVRYFVHQRSGNAVHRFRKHLVAEHPGDETNFLEFARQNLSARHRNSVIVDDVSVGMLSRRDLLAALSHLIQNSVVHAAGANHVQTLGIPQGMPISTMLATLYYTDLERSTDLTQQRLDRDELRLNMRFVDDYFFASSSHASAERFAGVMLAGFDSYGTRINRSKSTANFGSIGRLEHFIPWCGHLIDTFTMQIRVDYTRYRQCRLRDAVSVDTGPTWRTVLNTRASVHCFRPTVGAIHVDERINEMRTIWLNVYQAALLVAAKLLIYVREVRRIRNLVASDFASTYAVTAKSCRASLRGKLLRTRLADMGVTTHLRVPVLKADEVDLLTAEAFRKVISRTGSPTIRKILAPYRTRLDAEAERLRRQHHDCIHNLQLVVDDANSRDLLRLVP